MNSRVNLKLAGDLLDRCFRQAQGQADRGVELLFLLTELDSTYEKAEPTLEFLATRGLIRSYTSDSLRLTPRGVEVVVEELDLRTLPEAAPAAPAAASIPPVQAAPAAPTPTGRPRPPRPFRPTVSYEHEGETVAIELGWVAIMGRSQEADITLPDPRASKKHIEIRYAGDRYLVKDLGSANGTLLNGSYVDQQTLTHGDVLLVGRTEVTYACPEVMIEPRGEAPGDYEPPPAPRVEPRPNPVAEPLPVATARRRDAQVQPVGNELSTERPTARPASRTPPVEEPAIRPIPVPRPLRELSVRVPEPAPTPVRIVKGEPTHRMPELSASELFAASPGPSAEELFGSPQRPGRADFGDADTAERPKRPPFARAAPGEARGSGPGIDLFASGPQASSLVAAATPPAADLFDGPGESTGGTDDLFATTIVRPARGAVSPLPTPVAPRPAEDLLPPAEDLLQTDASFAATLSWPGVETPTQNEFERPPLAAGVRAGGSAADPEQTLIGMPAVILPQSRPFSDDEPPIPLPPDFFADVSVVDLGEPRFAEPEPPVADLSPSMEIPPEFDIREVSLVDTQANELGAEPPVEPGAALAPSDDLGDTLVPFVPVEPFAAPPYSPEPPPVLEALEPLDVAPPEPRGPDPFVERTPVDTAEQRPSGSGALLAALESLPEAEADLADDGQLSQEPVSYVDFVRTLDVLGERLRDAGIPDAPEVLEAILRLRRHPAVRAALT